VGWRDRDYARWSPEERNRFLGSSGSTAAPSSSRSVLRPGAAAAVAVSAAILVAGNLPRGHPLVPALHVNISTQHKTAPRSVPRPTISIGKIKGPSVGRVGGFLTLRGQLPAGETGTISVDGAFRHPPWRTLATVPTDGGAYIARIPLNQRGLLHLRVTYPDGHRAVGTIHVR
jgi:hypothetical protein